MLLVFSILLVCLGNVYCADCPNDVEVVCYWGSWSVYRKDVAEFTTENIDPSLCTSLIYTFVGLSLDFRIESIDSWSAIDKGGFANFTALKNPCLKTTIAIGGWNEGSAKYSVMASTEESRKSFAENLLRFLVYYGFDGVDLDWEYPTTRGGIPADGKNYIELLKVIKTTISPWGLRLTTAVPIDDNLLGTAYDAAAMAEVVDYVHLMAYDYVASTSTVTGLSAPLSAIKKTVSNWLNAGLPAEKLILGIPTYGRNFVLEREDKHDIGAPVEETGHPGEYTQENGFLAYYEVMQIIKDDFLEMKVVEVDGTNYAYGSGEWITFETEATVKTKAQYAVDQKLGGVMIWSVDTDDFQGLYGKKNTLLSAVNEVVKGKK